MRNWTSAAQTVSLQGSYGPAKLNFGGHTILPGAHVGGAGGGDARLLRTCGPRATRSSTGPL